MANKRKRTRPGNAREVHQNLQSVSGNLSGKDPVVKQALLGKFYPQVFSLRQYLVSKLPPKSKIRRKKILSIGLRTGSGENYEELSKFLDQTLIGELKYIELSQDTRWQQWATFSQRGADESSTFADFSRLGAFSQSEIVDFAIWLLMSKCHSYTTRTPHLLCEGFRKDVSARSVHQAESAPSAIPGVVSTYPNDHVISMKSGAWPQVLTLLGKEGEKIMIDLILDCGVFLAVSGGRGIYHQLSGQTLGELQALPQTSSLNRISSSPKASFTPKVFNRSPSSISFVRNRMLYARAALNGQGEVRFGLRHIHVLNRFPIESSQRVKDRDLDTSAPLRGTTGRSTIQVMMYIFPRQFGLHNVFTSSIDTRQTVQPFQDYTLREDEIGKKFPPPIVQKVPKRLRGKAIGLVQKLQVLHMRCPYKKLLEFYCPISTKSAALKPQAQQSVESSTKLTPQVPPIANGQSTPLSQTSMIKTSPQKPSMMDHATPVAIVSTFCQAVLHHLIPHEFWGSGIIQAHNEKNFHLNVDRFIMLRRFESLSLHEVSQGLKISTIEWLGPPEVSEKRLSKSDISKRWEIFHEFLYYIFDSLLIPLIRANFHVTESNMHRYRLFYFRHDVWRSLAEPALITLKHTMFEEVKLERAQKLLDSRTLGFSQMRLLPKETGVRPIMNLRRRSIKKGSKNLLGPSINSVLAPLYNTSKPSLLGSTLFSVGDLYKKLKTFKTTISASTPLYFAKLDVRAAFDTIPQAAVVKLISSLPSESEYRISKYMEMKPCDNYRSDITSKPARKWSSLALPLYDFQDFEEKLEGELAVVRKNTIFVENIVAQFRDTDHLLELLNEHINNNMVKIGKKFYRQKEGIPQGSVLSSLLCNYFYADLEAKHLDFLRSGDGLLLRLIDDFLLITPDRSDAKKFLQIMHDGLPDYGVTVNPDKTLVNFEANINGKKVARLLEGTSFPYCGSFIDTKTLDISRDRERRKHMPIVDSLTVEFSKTPGKSFHRKVLNTFKIQSHAMFLDTAFNSPQTVISNIHSAFIETATKMWTYGKCLPPGKQPGTKLLIKTIEDLTELAFVVMKCKGKNNNNIGYKNAVSKVEVEWLAMDAFKCVLKKRQSKYSRVLEWLDKRVLVLSRTGNFSCERMKRILET